MSMSIADTFTRIRCTIQCTKKYKNVKTDTLIKYIDELSPDEDDHRIIILLKDLFGSPRSDREVILKHLAPRTTISILGRLHNYFFNEDFLSKKFSTYLADDQVISHIKYALMSVMKSNNLDIAIAGDCKKFRDMIDDACCDQLNDIFFDACLEYRDERIKSISNFNVIFRDAIQHHPEFKKLPPELLTQIAQFTF